MLAGVGVVTGLRTVFQLDAALIVDDWRVFDYIKRSIEAPQAEKTLSPGFRSVAGEFRGKKLALVQAPPYPQTVAEAVSELYLLGARRIIVVSKGYRLSRRAAAGQATVMMANAAIPLDSVSRLVVSGGVPLLASGNMLSRARRIIEVRFPDVEWRLGYTVTVDSPRLRYTVAGAEEYSGYKGVVAMDSVTAPLYALQYEYTNLEALSMLTLYRQYSRVPNLIESSEDAISRLIEKEVKTEGLLATIALEVLTYE